MHTRWMLERSTPPSPFSRQDTNGPFQRRSGVTTRQGDQGVRQLAPNSSNSVRAWQRSAETVSLVCHCRWLAAEFYRTDLDNLCLVCESHHHLVHEGGWRMERLGGVTYTRRPNGTYRGLAPPGRSGGDTSCRIVRARASRGSRSPISASP